MLLPVNKKIKIKNQKTLTTCSNWDEQKYKEEYARKQCEDAAADERNSKKSKANWVENKYSRMNKIKS